MNPPSEAKAPRLAGRWCALRPVLQADYDELYALSTSPSTGFRWRFRGSTPSPDAFVTSLWNQVLAQFVVTSPGDNRPIGLVVANRADFRCGHAYIAVLADNSSVAGPVTMEAAALFIQYLFDSFNLNKLYFESLEFNLQQFASGVDRFFVEEGRLRNHDYYSGRWWDLYIMAIYREAWAASGSALIAEVPEDAKTQSTQFRFLNGNLEVPEALR